MKELKKKLMDNKDPSRCKGSGLGSLRKRRRANMLLGTRGLVLTCFGHFTMV